MAEKLIHTIKKNNNIKYFILISLAFLFALLNIKTVLTGQTAPDFVHDTSGLFRMRFIIPIMLLLAYVPWILVKKNKSDQTILFIVLIYWIVKQSPLGNVNYSWFPIGNFLNSWETVSIFLTLWIAWPWKEFLYNLFENKRLYKNIFWLVIGGFFILLFLQLGFRYYDFNVPGLDFGLFRQAIYNLSNLNWPYCSIRGYDNLWADHFHPIIIIAALFYKIFRSGYVMVFIQCLALASSIWPIIKIAEKLKFPNILSIALAVFLPLQGAIYHANGFGFYPETVAIPFIVWLCWAVICNPKYIYPFLFLTLFGKENMGIYIIIILGAIGLSFKDARKKIIIPMIISALWVLLSIKFVIPYFLGHDYGYFSYDKIGANIFQVAGAFITKPLLILEILFNPINKLHAILASVSPAGAMFFAGPYALISLPFIFETALSSREIMHIWGLHYYAPVAMSILLIIILNAKWLKDKFKVNNLILSGLSLAIILNLIIFSNNNHIRYISKKMFDKNTYIERNNIAQIVNLVPKDKDIVVCAQDTLVAYLVERKEIYEYPNHMDSADILVFALDRSYYPSDQKNLFTEIKGFLNNPAYGVFDSNSEAIIIFKKENNNFKDKPINQDFMNKINEVINDK